MEPTKKKIFIIITVIVVVFLLGFIPIWPKEVQSGSIQVSTWTKLELLLGLKYID